MPDEDRFGDLGAEHAKQTPAAGRRLAELDAAEPARPPDRRSFGRRYTWVVGVAFAIVVAIVAIESLPHAGAGINGPAVGRPIPRFAAPGALGPIDADPNIKQSASDRSQGNRTPACAVRGPAVVRSCDLVRKPLALTFIVPGEPSCERYLDRIQSLQPQFPGVNFAAVVSGRPKSVVAALVRSHGWTFPVAVDRGLRLFTVYDIALCATTTFVRRGGVVFADKVKAQAWSDAQLRRELRATVAASR